MSPLEISLNCINTLDIDICIKFVYSTFNSFSSGLLQFINNNQLR